MNNVMACNDGDEFQSLGAKFDQHCAPPPFQSSTPTTSAMEHQASIATWTDRGDVLLRAVRLRTGRTIRRTLSAGSRF